MEETKHSSEPWRVYAGVHILDRTGRTLTVARRDMSAVFRDPEDARRIVAAVSFCAGISTDALELDNLTAVARRLESIACLAGEGPEVTPARELFKAITDTALDALRALGRL